MKNKVSFLLLLLFFFGSVLQTDAAKRTNKISVVTIPTNLSKYIPQHNLDQLKTLYETQKLYSTPTTQQWQNMFNVISKLITCFENLEQKKVPTYRKNAQLTNEISILCSQTNQNYLTCIKKLFFFILNKISKTSPSQNVLKENLNMLLFLLDYFNIKCLSEPLLLKLARDLFQQKNVDLIEQLNDLHKKKIRLYYSLFCQQACKNHLGYDIDCTDPHLYKNLTAAHLVNTEILPAIENHNQALTYTKEYAQHPQLHLFFDNIPYCQFKNQLVQDIYQYARSILKKPDRQKIFDSLPEGILKVTLRLIAQDDQLQFDTNVIDLKEAREAINASKNFENLYLNDISSIITFKNNQCAMTYEKLINYIFLLLPHLSPALKRLALSLNTIKILPKEMIVKLLSDQLEEELLKEIAEIEII